jgi:hypothetical protein
MMNLNGSSIFDFSKDYAVYSSIMLPGTDRVGPIVILGGVEKMVNIAIPYF